MVIERFTDVRHFLSDWGQTVNTYRLQSVSISKRAPLLLAALGILTLGSGTAAAASPGDATTVTAKRVDTPLKEFKDAPAGHYELDPQHAHLLFQVSHYGGLSRPIIRFEKVDADYDWDPTRPEATKVTARISPTSLRGLDRDWEMRTNGPTELRGIDASENGKYRFITFESKSINFNGLTSDGKHKGTMTGDLTLIGVTRPITLDLIYNGYYQSSLGQRKMGFSAKGTVKRFDYGMADPSSVGNEVDVIMELEFGNVVRAARGAISPQAVAPGPAR